MKELIKKTLKKAGFQIKRFPDGDYLRRIKIINDNHINLVLDVGANNGGYALSMREFGYTKKIISFEPLKSAFSELKISAQKDKNWILNNYALGNEDTKSVINISGNSFSSSILNMLPQHLNSAPESRFISQEEIEIKKLDTIFSSMCSPTDNVMLKIDTQGYEKNVIDGAIESLPKIKIIQLEMSIVQLYESELMMTEMINYLDAKGYQLFSLENGFGDSESGQLLQVDGIFVRR
jgi:FkbM family methyltransferase